MTCQTRTPAFTSPLNLMQERYRDRPWALLVGCILFNMTRGDSALPVLERFLERWPSYDDVLAELDMSYWTVKEMSGLFKPLGFQNRRADRILRMSYDFSRLRPDVNEDADVSELHGIGKYAADSFNMFFRGYIVEDATDKELKAYVSWAKSLSS